MDRTRLYEKENTHFMFFQFCYYCWTWPNYWIAIIFLSFSLYFALLIDGFWSCILVFWTCLLHAKNNFKNFPCLFFFCHLTKWLRGSFKQRSYHVSTWVWVVSLWMVNNKHMSWTFVNNTRSLKNVLAK